MNIQSRPSIRSVLAFATSAALLSTLCATAALSADQDPPARKINYADLNIQSPDGARVLYRRIRTAAIEVCHSSDSWNLSTKHLREECVKRAVDEAVRSVPSAQLAALNGTARQPDAVVASSR